MFRLSPETVDGPDAPDSTRTLPDQTLSTFLSPKGRKLIFANGKAGGFTKSPCSPRCKSA